MSLSPKIESSTPAFVSVAKESPLVLTAESAGEPRPVVTWMQKDKALNSGKSLYPSCAEKRTDIKQK